jgi:prepilin-type N-terminal cleavage/methylation domain-containing protein
VNTDTPIPAVGAAPRGGWTAGLRGFTLIELILVMSILTIAISITAPALANFFRGRSLDSEARRLLALVKQGQSRAVSEGIPMLFWVDANNGAFGLEAEPSYEDVDAKAVQFNLDPDMQVELTGATPGIAAPVVTGIPLQTDTPFGSAHANLPKIRFLPDGSISDAGLQTIRLTSKDGASFWITPSRNRLSYEIRNRIN